MIKQAPKKSISARKRLKFLEPSPTQEFNQKPDDKPDIITDIQCHHYLSLDDRLNAIKLCYDNLKEGGIFVTFENIHFHQKRNRNW